MTHAEACTALRNLAWRVTYGRLSLEEWALEVSRVIAEAYPDVAVPIPLDRTPWAELGSFHRTSTRRGMRHLAAARSEGSYPPLGDGPAS